MQWGQGGICKRALVVNVHQRSYNFRKTYTVLVTQACERLRRFASAQISEWYEAGYLPPALEMRSSEDPEGAFTTLLQLCASAPNGKPPFVQLRDHVRDRSLSASMSARN